VVGDGFGLWSHHPVVDVDQRCKELVAEEAALIDNVKIEAAKASNRQHICKVVLVSVVDRFGLCGKDFPASIRTGLRREKVKARINRAVIE
jgi:hypothetical protein